MPGCLPMFTATRAGCMSCADINKDGKVDRYDAEKAVVIMAKVVDKSLDQAVVYIDKFNLKVDKLIAFLEASKVIFGQDPQTFEMINTAIYTLKLFKLTTAAGAEISSKAKQVTIPKDPAELGKTISTIQESFATIETYVARFEGEGIKFGALGTELKKVDAALDKFAQMQNAWMIINKAINTPPATPIAQATPQNAEPAVTEVVTPASPATTTLAIS